MFLDIKFTTSISSSDIYDDIVGILTGSITTWSQMSQVAKVNQAASEWVTDVNTDWEVYQARSVIAGNDITIIRSPISGETDRWKYAMLRLINNKLGIELYNETDVPLTTMYMYNGNAGKSNFQASGGEWAQNISNYMNDFINGSISGGTGDRGLQISVSSKHIFMHANSGFTKCSFNVELEKNSTYMQNGNPSHYNPMVFQWGRYTGTRWNCNDSKVEFSYGQLPEYNTGNKVDAETPALLKTPAMREGYTSHYFEDVMGNYHDNSGYTALNNAGQRVDTIVPFGCSGIEQGFAGGNISKQSGIYIASLGPSVSSGSTYTYDNKDFYVYKIGVASGVGYNATIQKYFCLLVMKK